MSRYRYYICWDSRWHQGGELVGVDDVASAISFRGRPDEYPVRYVLPLPDTDDCVVLQTRCPTSAGEVKPFHNLARCRGDGSVVWRATYPASPERDSYSRFRCEGGAIVASSVSYERVRIDPDRGEVLSAERPRFRVIDRPQVGCLGEIARLLGLI